MRELVSGSLFIKTSTSTISFLFLVNKQTFYENILNKCYKKTCSVKIIYSFNYTCVFTLGYYIYIMWLWNNKEIRRKGIVLKLPLKYVQVFAWLRVPNLKSNLENIHCKNMWLKFFSISFFFGVDRLKQTHSVLFLYFEVLRMEKVKNQIEISLLKLQKFC